MTRRTTRGSVRALPARTVGADLPATIPVRSMARSEYEERGRWRHFR